MRVLCCALALGLAGCAGYISQSRISMLHNGMTQEEVRNALDASPQASYFSGSTVYWEYRDWNGAPYEAVFQDGQLVQFGPNAAQQKMDRQEAQDIQNTLNPAPRVIIQQQ